MPGKYVGSLVAKFGIGEPGMKLRPHNNNSNDRGFAGGYWNLDEESDFNFKGEQKL